MSCSWQGKTPPFACLLSLCAPLAASRRAKQYRVTQHAYSKGCPAESIEACMSFTMSRRAPVLLQPIQRIDRHLAFCPSCCLQSDTSMFCHA
eukprot:2572091-Amphidinium_carterae.1